MVLLTPGTTIPTDMAKPEIIKYRKLGLVLLEIERCFSRITEKSPIRNAKKVNKAYFNLNVCFLLISFISEGIVLKISPIKIELVWMGNLNKKYCKKLLNTKTPKNIPIKIGNKNLMFFLMSEKKFNILSNNFS